MATTYDYVALTTSKFFGSGIPAHRDPFYTIKRRLNVADMCTSFGITAFGAADVVKVIDIPDNTLVIGVECKIIVAGTPATSTMQIGDITGITSTAGWQNATDLVATAGTIVFSETYNSNVYPKRYIHATDPTINIKFNHAAATGTFDITVLCVDLNN